MDYKQGLEMMMKVSRLEVTPLIKQELQYLLKKSIENNKVTEKYVRELQIEMLNKIGSEIEMREFLFKVITFYYNFTKDYVDIDLQEFNLDYSNIYRRLNTNMINGVVKKMKEHFITQEFTEEQIVKQVIFVRYDFIKHHENDLVDFILSDIYLDYSHR